MYLNNDIDGFISCISPFSVELNHTFYSISTHYQRWKNLWLIDLNDLYIVFCLCSKYIARCLGTVFSYYFSVEVDLVLIIKTKKR